MKNFAEKFLSANPELKKIEFIYVDFNGIARGKSASPKTLIKAVDGGLKIGLDQEKTKAGQILASAYQATERHRMDFDPNQ